MNFKKMRENNCQNDSPCRFAETLVAVLYGEATPAERKEFNKHYNDCSICREELITFGSVRDAVAEWRATDFDSVQMPAIILPEIKNELIAPNVQISWGERIRSFLLPGGRLQSAAAFGALVICALLLAIFSYTMINRFAVGNVVTVADVSNMTRTERIPSVPTPSPLGTVNPASESDPKQTTNNSKDKVEINTKPIQIKTKPAVRQSKSVIAQLSTRSLNKPVKSPDVKDQTVPKTPELAIESVDDLEDHSLRLSDLLDEVTPSM